MAGFPWGFRQAAVAETGWGGRCVGSSRMAIRRAFRLARTRDLWYNNFYRKAMAEWGVERCLSNIWTGCARACGQRAICSAMGLDPALYAKNLETVE